MEWMVLFDVDDSVDGNNEEALGVVRSDDDDDNDIPLCVSVVDAGVVVFFVAERAELGDSMWFTIGLDEQQLALVVRLVGA